MAESSPSLYPYQERAVKFLQYRKGCGGLFQEMGTGKSRVALSYCDRERLDRILVACPISVAGVWEQEVIKLGLDWEVLNLTSGTLVERSKLLANSYTNKPLLVIVNYEAWWRNPLRQAIQKWKPDCVIADEVHRCKSRNARQSRFAHQLAGLVRHRIGLTGTPITNGIQDLYSIYRFIDPDVFGTRWAEFDWKYLEHGGYLNYQITGYRNTEEVAQKVRDTAFQISKAEALDLPPRVDVVLPIKLDPQTRSKYEDFRKHALTEIEGTDENGKPLRGVALARIVLTQLLRLQQITSGFVGTDNGGVIFLSDEKVRACKELVEDALAGGHQVVVFCRFLKDIERLSATLPHSTAIYGAIDQTERAARIAAFQANKIKVMIAQIQVGSLGISLTAADVAVFFSLGFSLSDFSQAKDRIHRIGQDKPCTYYLLEAERTVDQKVRQALIDKTTIAGKVVDLDYAKKLFSD